MKQKSQSLFLLLWVLAIVTGCSPALDDSPPSDSQAPVMPLTEVIRQGEKIIYSGPLTAEANRTAPSVTLVVRLINFNRTDKSECNNGLLQHRF